MFSRSILACAFASTSLAGTIIWDGRFNEFTSSTDLNNWSWGNQVGPYQYYIHGAEPVTRYVNLSPNYKNPADTGSRQGARITIDSTARWNSDMWRTELIPQTSAPINQGRVWYHFSMRRSATNAPSINHEHQVNFFESHFTEMKYGWISGDSGTSNNNLQWMVGGQSRWRTVWEADVWHNVAYEIDFGAGTVAFHHSTGSNPLVLTAGPVSASTSSNGADWHLGVLRLPRSGYDNSNAEDWYFSGVYVETGSLTTSVTHGGGDPPVSSATSTTRTTTSSRTTLTTSTRPPSSTTSTTAPPSSSTTRTSTSTTRPPSTTSTSSSPSPTAVAEHWAQCGGNGWTGPTACASPYTCQCQNEWYCQCL